MSAKKLLKGPTVERLKEVYRYDPDTGVFTRLIEVGGKAPGTPVGHVKAFGEREGARYLYIKLDRVLYLAHRLAWLYMTREMPAMIDHIDRDGLNNRFRNLRQATSSQNGFNRTFKNIPQTGFRGVVTRGKKWGSQIKVRDRCIWLGTFETPELASAAYLNAAKAHFGEFANLIAEER